MEAIVLLINQGKAVCFVFLISIDKVKTHIRFHRLLKSEFIYNKKKGKKYKKCWLGTTLAKDHVMFCRKIKERAPDQGIRTYPK